MLSDQQTKSIMDLAIAYGAAAGDSNGRDYAIGYTDGLLSTIERYLTIGTTDAITLLLIRHAVETARTSLETSH